MRMRPHSLEEVVVGENPQPNCTEHPSFTSALKVCS